MELLSLHLQHFRQHADSRITFARGLTGIIGTNGAGKSTVLEAIAFALYGVSAARGSKDSIKHRRAPARASVHVELAFQLGPHHVRLVRSLTAAAVYLDGSETPVAASLGGVTAWAEERLGMTRTEFFSTYFTGQKELAVMAALAPADRARFLARVLGYDRLEAAQQLVRRQKASVTAEANGLRAVVPAPAALLAEVAEARARHEQTRAEHATSTAAEQEAARAMDDARPTWERVQARRDEQRRHEAAHAAVCAREEALARDVLRLEHEAAAIDEATRALPVLEAELARLPGLVDEGARLDREAAADTERQRLLGTRDHLEALLAQEETAEVLQAAEEERQAAVRIAIERVAEWNADVEKAQRRRAEEESAWREELAAARAALQQARASVRPLIARREALVARGPESPCTTCGVALGERFPAVLASLDAEIAAATADGTTLAARAVALETEPESVTEWTRELQQDTASLQQARRDLADAELALRDVQRRQADRHQLEADVARVTGQVAALPTTYDVARHAIVREELARLAPLHARRAVALDKAASAAHVAAEREMARDQARGLATERARLEEALRENGLTAEAFEAERQAFACAEATHQRATERARETADADARAAEALTKAEQRAAELSRQAERLTALDHERRLLEELDRAYTDLRTDLNAALRPELAEIAGELLDTLTDGRYAHAELTADYELTVLEDGLVKPIISGGEEDLCNLVLRLAISQLIASRAGQPLALLVLDEVFAALDEQRRANVLTLLRRLSDRFAQVILITHDASVRDALDQVLTVTYDPATGTSSVAADDGADGLSATMPADVLEVAA